MRDPCTFIGFPDPSAHGVSARVLPRWYSPGRRIKELGRQCGSGSSGCGKVRLRAPLGLQKSTHLGLVLVLISAAWAAFGGLLGRPFAEYGLGGVPPVPGIFRQSSREFLGKFLGHAAEKPSRIVLGKGPEYGLGMLLADLFRGCPGKFPGPARTKSAEKPFQTVLGKRPTYRGSQILTFRASRRGLLVDSRHRVLPKRASRDPSKGP